MNTLVRRDKTIRCSPDAPLADGGFPRNGLCDEFSGREQPSLLVPDERAAAPTSHAAVGTRQPAGTQPLLLREQQSAEVQRSEWTQDDRSWTRYYL